MDAAEKLWVCEKGHVDDHHLDTAGACLGCGGSGHDAEPGPTGEPVSKGPCRDCEGTGDEPNVWCSRCGGKCEEMSADQLAREYIERLRVNVGLVEENKQLKHKVRELTGG